MQIDNLSIKEIKERISNGYFENIEELVEIMEKDSRKGVRDLVTWVLHIRQKQMKRLENIQRLLTEERNLWKNGYQMVGGIDEAGRGPLAGPVVAACVIFPQDVYIEGIDDSKKLTAAKREELFDIIIEKALAVGVGRVGPERIDEINILNATYEAMEQAVSKCSLKPDCLLIDAVELKKCTIPQFPLIKGDARSHSIAAASIVAKVTRDREMIKWHSLYPEYGFDKHKGYGTALHIEKIRERGLSPIHRRTFTSNLF